MSPSEYRRVLDADVDPQRWKGDRTIRLHIVAHVLVVLAVGWTAAAHARTWAWPLMIVLGMVAGHSAFVLAFAGHEVTHGGGGFRTRRAHRLWERVCWTGALFATATLERATHNRRHHPHANEATDPDRRLTLDELRALQVESVAPWLFPNAEHPIVSGLVGASFSVFSYHTSLLGHSFRGTGALWDLRLTAKQKRQVAGELAWNVAVWLGAWALSGFAASMALFLAVTYLTTTTFAGSYIATNHLLHGPSDEDDPLATTVSLDVPRWVDFLHLNFSHHVEHHLYPTLPAPALPVIRAALRKHFPERFTVLRYGEARRLLLSVPLAWGERNELVRCDGSGAVPVPFPVNASSDGSARKAA